MPESMAPTSLKPFAAGLAATLSLVGGAIVAGQVAGDMFGAPPAQNSDGSEQVPQLPIPRARVGVDRPPAVISAVRQPISGVAVTVSARPGARRVGAQDITAAPRRQPSTSVRRPASTTTPRLTPSTTRRPAGP